MMFENLFVSQSRSTLWQERLDDASHPDAQQTNWGFSCFGSTKTNIDVHSSFSFYAVIHSSCNYHSSFSKLCAKQWCKSLASPLSVRSVRTKFERVIGLGLWQSRPRPCMTTEFLGLGSSRSEDFLPNLAKFLEYPVLNFSILLHLHPQSKFLMAQITRLHQPLRCTMGSSAKKNAFSGYFLLQIPKLPAELMKQFKMFACSSHKKTTDVSR